MSNRLGELLVREKRISLEQLRDAQETQRNDNITLGYALAKMGYISDEEITELNIPTGVPLRYELGPDMSPVQDIPVDQRYLMDPAEVAARAEAVAKQASGG